MGAGPGIHPKRCYTGWLQCGISGYVVRRISSVVNRRTVAARTTPCCTAYPICRVLRPKTFARPISPASVFYKVVGVKKAMLQILIEDSRMALRRESATKASIISAFLRLRGFRITLRYRLAHALRQRGHRILAGLFHRSASRMGADIHPSASIAGGLCLPHPYGIVIGSY